MIFYFTRAGSSRWVVEALGAAFDEPLVSIVDALSEDKNENAYPLREREKMFSVFPVHSWGPTVLMSRFIPQLILSGYKGQEVYFVCICGDDCGYTDRIMRSTLARRGITLTGGFFVQMPNNCISMPGLDVDSKEVKTEKLRKAPRHVDEVVEAIQQKKNPSLYYAGNVPPLKNYMVYPLSTHFMIGSNQFYTTGTCISCGIRAKVRPTGTISLSGGGEPEWADTCI